MSLTLLRPEGGPQLLDVCHSVLHRDLFRIEPDSYSASEGGSATSMCEETTHANRFFNSLRFIVLMFAFLFSVSAFAQEDNNRAASETQTIFNGGPRSFSAYGAISNKFTTIRGKYANVVEAYGGIFINHKVLIGIGGGALTNRISVPAAYSIDPLRDMSYEYGQFGVMTEYVIGSDKPFHVAFSLFSGPGFTVQYERHNWHDDDFDWDDNESEDTNWFFVAEPGVQFEMNVFKWMRFSPGVSYRAAFGSDGLGMKDSNISNISYNATFKFGLF